MTKGKHRAIHVDWECREVEIETGKFVFYVGGPQYDGP